VQFHNVEPARQSGAVSFSVAAGDVHRQMKLTNRMPAVCGALRSQILQAQCGINLVHWSGPEQGTTATATFKFVSTDLKDIAAKQSDLDTTEDFESAPVEPLVIIAWRHFQELARAQMERHFSQELNERSVPGVPKRFDMVSNDGTIVGDAKYLSLVGGKRTPPAKFMEIAGHIWLLEKTNAKRIFLIFGKPTRRGLTLAQEVQQSGWTCRNVLSEPRRKPRTYALTINFA
jgi:hypothetical protein